MTTEDIIIHIFCYVDDRLKGTIKDSRDSLWPSEVITIGILLALKGGHFRAFYGYYHAGKHRWLKRDYDGLFGGLPDRTTLLRQLNNQQDYTAEFLAQPSVLNVVDSYPMELIFPIRERRSKQQFGGKSKDKGRWSVGVKLCWILNGFGHVCGWIWDGYDHASKHKMNYADRDFLSFFEEYDGEAIMLADWGFRCANGIPDNVKLCKKGTWNERMLVETSFSLLTVVCHAKKIFHRAEDYIEARLAYTVAMFNVCLALFHQLHPDAITFQDEYR